MQARLNGREQRAASREQMLSQQDAESASQVAEARAAAASSYSSARQDVQQEYKAQREALARERHSLEADRSGVLLLLLLLQNLATKNAGHVVKLRLLVLTP